MEIKFIVVGKTDAEYLKSGEKEYVKRLKHYTKMTYLTIPDIKNVQKLTEQQRKEKEGEFILKALEPNDFVILLDEAGRSKTSKQLSQLIEQHQLQSTKCLVFIVGGAYGFSQEVYEKANQKISLSPMTFSHQMVRLFFLEQLYRAHTILRGEPYHHG